MWEVSHPHRPHGVAIVTASYLEAWPPDGDVVAHRGSVSPVGERKEHHQQEQYQVVHCHDGVVVMPSPGFMAVSDPKPPHHHPVDTHGVCHYGGYQLEPHLA